MYKLTIRGTGRLNGTVTIYKEIEIEDVIAGKITGPYRNDVLIGLLAVHYPGVAFEPNRISFNLSPIIKPKEVKPPKEKNEKSIKPERNSTKKTQNNKTKESVASSIVGAFSSGINNVAKSIKSTNDFVQEKKISDDERFILLKNGKSTKFNIRENSGEIFATEKFIRITLIKEKLLGGKDIIDIEIPPMKIKEIEYNRILFGLTKQIIIKCFDRSIIQKFSENNDIVLSVKNEKEAIALVEYAKQFI